MINVMLKAQDENGVEIDVYTKEEYEKALKDNEVAVIEKYKKENPNTVQKTPEEIAAEKKAAEDKAKADAEPLNQMKAQLDALSKTLRDRDINDAARAYAGADKDKQAEFKKAFERLTGFEATPEGLVEQAEMAARSIGIDPKTVNVGDFAGTGGNRNVDAPKGPVNTEADKVVQKVLGITPEDVKKYSPDVSAGADKQGESNK